MAGQITIKDLDKRLVEVEKGIRRIQVPSEGSVVWAELKEQLNKMENRVLTLEQQSYNKHQTITVSKIEDEPT